MRSKSEQTPRSKKRYMTMLLTVAPANCKAFSELLIMDIAYLASTTVNWMPDPAALSAGAGAAADDDSDDDPITRPL